jgi:hypothetical protein
MFGAKKIKEEKKKVEVEHLLRKGLGFYSTGFIIVSDALAYFVKRTLLIVHDFIPLVLLHKGVDLLQDTKDTIGRSLIEFTFCPKCSGNGSIFARTDDGKTINEVCPMCHGKGKLDIDLSKERCSDDICITKEAALPLAPISHIEEMIKSSKKEWEKTHAYCSRCNGKGSIIKTAEDGQTKEEVCTLCHGTGKDYGELARELMNRCAGDLVEIGYEVDDAWTKCRQIYPVFFDKEKLLKEAQKKGSKK